MRHHRRNGRSRRDLDDNVPRRNGATRDWSFATGSSATWTLPVKSATEDDIIIAPSDALPFKTQSDSDPWNSISRDLAVNNNNDKSWSDFDKKGKCLKIAWILTRICLAVGLLYFFVCSLDMMQAAFQLVGGRAAGSFMTNSSLLNNPVCGMMIGVLITVLLQSSSSSTSVVVTMVAAGMLNVQQSIPIIMGANIGTSLTNTIVSMAQSGDKDTFRRAFAGATVHDMFNWQTVIVLLPLETASHYLYHMTSAMVVNIVPPEDTTNPQFLKVITDPLIDLIIEIDKSVIDAISKGLDRQKFPLSKFYCVEVVKSHSETFLNTSSPHFVSDIQERQFTFDIIVQETGGPELLVTWDEVVHENSTLCTHLLTGTGTEYGTLTEPGAGVLLLFVSLSLMIICLLILVKILNSLLQGQLASLLAKRVNATLPGKAACLTGYLAILMGAILTILVQSSSVFTCTLTPLVGLGIVKLETVYPLTLGSNIGTTFTSLVAALTADPDYIKESIQLSLCHLFFNISGILLFFPIPFMRRIPIAMARFMGNTTADYRWFAAAYVIFAFFLIPVIVFVLSLAGWYVLLAVAIPVIIIAIFVFIVTVMQNKCASKLPNILKTWDFLPVPLRSLEPYDSMIRKCCFQHECCRKRCRVCQEEDTSAFDNDTLYIIPNDWISQEEENGAGMEPSEVIEILEVGVPETVIQSTTLSLQSGYTGNVGGRTTRYMYVNPAYLGCYEVSV